MVAVYGAPNRPAGNAADDIEAVARLGEGVPRCIVDGVSTLNVHRQSVPPQVGVAVGDP